MSEFQWSSKSSNVSVLSTKHETPNSQIGTWPPTLPSPEVVSWPHRAGFFPIRISQKFDAEQKRRQLCNPQEWNMCVCVCICKSIYPYLSLSISIYFYLYLCLCLQYQFYLSYLSNLSYLSYLLYLLLSYLSCLSYLSNLSHII